MIHQLKIRNEYFDRVLNDQKAFEVRINDRDFQVGDKVQLREIEGVDAGYTGNEIIVKITYLLQNIDGIINGYCVFGFEKYNI